MAPLLQPGEEILVDPQAYRQAEPAVGDLVLVQHPQREGLQLLKRVTAVRSDGDCFVEGDNPAHSTDSRTFGWIPPGCLLGRITSRFA